MRSDGSLRHPYFAHHELQGFFKQAQEGAEHSQGQEVLHTDDPGEVIHPESAETQTPLCLNSRITWASLLNAGGSDQMRQSSQRMQPTSRLLSSESEPDPDLLLATSNLPVSPGFKKIEDTSANSCEDRSPESKTSKVGRGTRRSRGHRRNSKENLCFDNLTRGQQRRFEGRCAHAHGQGRVEDGWEAAADALGLHTIRKKNFSNVLQPQAPLFNDQQRSRTMSAPLLGLKPNKQQGRAWQGDLRRPNCPPGRTKQKSSGVDMRLLRKLDVFEKPQCLICTEDLDITDTSFEGCNCGFNICLFCYHTIAQESGRCPGCRGLYKQDITAKPACLLPR
ncbi:hypothetical protein GOP47_0025111 [Adiantum capillus-veneris]|uniref:RING-type domain-containing protein n=1 Tax=Adiantum capillus-veneris TaxID=13818 RepID=A0A9D4U5M6_ADICA|nr:hypothetical protein GOP47_0025111 [Adiantum capillus-veneris]